jgi:hypothetical protein
MPLIERVGGPAPQETKTYSWLDRGGSWVRKAYRVPKPIVQYGSATEESSGLPTMLSHEEKEGSRQYDCTLIMVKLYNSARVYTVVGRTRWMANRSAQYGIRLYARLE